MEFVFVYITCPDKASALILAKGAVQARLAACANILPDMVSVYEWDGALQTDNETVLILKTRESLANQLTDWVTLKHPYDVPCILQLPILAGNDAYLSWVIGQTEGNPDE